jgi:hypothetical protein
MQTGTSAKAAILTVAIVLVFFVSWELYLRHQGAVADYDDSPELWANSRDMVYEPADKATVFIGSSRIKYDLDIHTWETLTHNHAIQLAWTGSSPRHCLSDLAADPKFKGRLIVDITEVLFFSKHGNPRPDAGIDYYKTRTPAQRFSFVLNLLLEPRLAFINEDSYALNALLGKMHVKDRPGVYPFLDFPAGFAAVMFNRQDKMTNEFVADTNQHNQVKAIWRLLGSNPTPPMSGKPLDSLIASVKSSVNKIKARGGEVIFTRTPSSGFFFMAEQHLYPRRLYWDRLLTETGCKGIYFKDNPVTAGLMCPEFSHLRPSDAVIYTTSLIESVKKEIRWKF